MAVAAFHASLRNAVMVRLRELSLLFAVAVLAEFRFGDCQQVKGSDVGTVRRYRRKISLRGRRRRFYFRYLQLTVGSMALSASDVVPTVHSTPVVISLLFALVAFEADVRYLLRSQILEGSNLGYIAAISYVLLAGPVARFAANVPVFPARQAGQLPVHCPQEISVLIRVTCLAGVAPEVVIRLIVCLRVHIGLPGTGGSGGCGPEIKSAR
jgi:hypothetical protein